MNSFKKWSLLIVVTAFISCTTTAQQAPVLSTIANKDIIITNFKAYEKDAKQVVEWNAAAGDATNYWQVQSSADGKTFRTIAIVLGDDPQQPGTFNYTVRSKPGKGLQKYYRLCHIDTGGSQQISEIIRPAK